MPEKRRLAKTQKMQAYLRIPGLPELLPDVIGNADEEIKVFLAAILLTFIGCLIEEIE